MSRTATKESGGKIACYSIQSQISVGGQGTVYKAIDPQTGSDVAIKVLAEKLTDDPVLRLRFAQECQVTRALKHPNIVRVMDFGLDGNKPYLVMEYVEGETLGQRLDREGRIPEAEAVSFITQIGAALQWAHQRGLIHRDVTPDNILVTPKGVAKLTDLGLAKNLGGDFNLTRSQSSLGTPNFMAPEQFEDAKRADALSDLYSLAATLYMAVTGEIPFRVKNVLAIAIIYKKKLTNDIAAPRQLVGEVSERVDAAICQAMRSKRDERPVTIQAFLDALAAPPPEPVEVSKLTAKGKERRAGVRVPTGGSAACRPVDRAADATWRGALINISEFGLCMEMKRRFEPGTTLSIRMGGKKLRRRSLLVRVRWVKKLSTNRWQVGCQYDQPLTLQEVEELS